MKITCQACGAYYTILDDKVKGKRLKIRCKSCGTAIVVNTQDPSEATASSTLHEPPEAPQEWATELNGDVWSVNLSETDSRDMSAAEIATAWRAGTLPSDVFVWKSGMTDWVPLSKCAELQALIDSSAKEIERAAGPVKSRASLVGSRATDTSDLFATVDVAGSEEDVRRSAPPPAGGAKPTGARNENSVLFSLDALKAGFPQNAPKAEPPREEASGNPFGMGNARAAGPRGTMLSLVDNDALLTAPAKEPPPPIVHTVPQAGGSGLPNPKQKRILIAGLIAGGLAVGGLGLAAGVMLSGNKAEPTTATKAGTEANAGAQAPGAAGSAEAPKPEEKPAATAPEASAAVTAVAPAAPSGESAPPSASSKSTSPETGTKKHKEPREKKEKEKEKVKVTKEEAGSAEAPPFSKAAAISALTAAAEAAGGCKKSGGPTGTGKVQVTFAPSGRVTTATVPEPPFAGTPVGGCVAAAFRKAKVPAFSGDSITVAKGFSVK